MRQKLVLIFVCSALLHSPTLAQAVPEGVHEEASSASDVCGVTGQDALAKHSLDRTCVELIPRPVEAED